MYSFAQREDTIVIDEPLYAYYLARTGADHPGREEVIASMDQDPQKIFSGIHNRGKSSSVVFIKNMCHHFIDLPVSYILEFKNVFLIRDPADMLRSLSIQVPNPVIRDTGLRDQWDIFTKLVDSGQLPVVIDAETLSNDPLRVLTLLCEKLEIPFLESMLSWNKGPRPEDGIWAKHWYQKVHNSSGFTRYVKTSLPFPENLASLLEECKPYYLNLYQLAIK